MSQPVLFVGSTSQDVRRVAHQRLCQLREKPGCPADSITIFSAGGRAERAWRELLRNDGGTTWLPRFAEFDSWCLDAVSSCSEQPVRWVGRADRHFILRDLLPQIQPKLGILRNLSRSHSLVRELDTLLADLRRAGVERVPSQGDWVRDLQTIVDSYNRYLDTRGGIDIERAPALFARDCEGDPSLPQVVLVDGMVHLPPVRWTGVQALARRVPHLLATYVVPGLDQRPTSIEALLEATRDTVVHRALQLWAEAFPEVELVHCGEPGERAKTVAGLFDWQRPRSAQPPSLTLTGAHTVRDELSRIAADIRARCEEPVNLDRFTVVLPDPATVAGALESAFAEHGVPVQILRARPHSTYPVVRRVLRLFELAQAQWPVATLTDIFGDGSLRLCDEGHTLDIHRLRRYCNQWRIATLQELEECAETFRRRLASSDLEAYELAGHDLDCIRTLRAACERFGRGMTAVEWADGVEALLDLTAGHLWQTRDALSQEAAGQLELLSDAVDSVVKRAERWLDNAARPAADFFDWLRLELENSTEPLDDRPRAAVRVIGPLQLMGGVQGVVYFAGLNEGSWPGSHVPGTLVARHQEELAPIREHLPDPVHLAIHQLAVCLTEADELHLSYANWRDGREQLRSPLLEDLLISWPHLPALPANQQVTSRPQLLALLAAGNDGWSDAAAVDMHHLRTLQQMQYARSDADRIGVYDGALGLEPAPGGAPTLDSTRLKAYAQCPMKYYFRYVLNLRPPLRLTEDLQGHQSGTMVHKILERFNNEYSGELRSDEAWRTMVEIARQQVEKEELRPVLRDAELQRLVGRSAQVPGGILGPVLEAEREQRTGTAKKPAFARLLVPLRQSGLTPPPELQQSLEARFRFKLGEQDVQGTIDRIDVSDDYSMVAVIDYKTEHAAGLASFDAIDAGLDFQLALYLLAARRFFVQDGGRPALAAAYFSVRDARYLCGIGEVGTLGRNVTQKGPGALAQLRAKELPSEQFDLWLDGVAQRVGRIGGLIAHGQYNLTVNHPEDAGCAFCDFATICRQDIGLQPRRHAAHVGNPEVYSLQPIAGATEGDNGE